MKGPDMTTNVDPTQIGLEFAHRAPEGDYYLDPWEPPERPPVPAAPQGQAQGHRRASHGVRSSQWGASLNANVRMPVAQPDASGFTWSAVFKIVIVVLLCGATGGITWGFATSGDSRSKPRPAVYGDECPCEELAEKVEEMLTDPDQALYLTKKQRETYRRLVNKAKGEYDEADD